MVEKRNKRRFWLLALALVLLAPLFLASPASAAQSIPYKINFQGRLTDNSGNVLPDGSYNIKFRLYNALENGTSQWNEDRVAGAPDRRVQITGGLFNIQFGDVSPLPPSLFNNASALFLEVELPTPASATCGTAACAVFSEGPMTPRQPLAAAAYAFNADTIDGIDGASLVQLSPGSPQSGSISVDGTIATTGQVQGSTAVLSGATSLTLGSNTNTGSIVIRDGTNNNRSVTLNVAALGSGYSLTLPTNAPGVSQCLQTTAGSASQLAFDSCDGSVNLQTAFDNAGTIQTAATGSAANFQVTLRDSTGTDASMLVNAATGSTGKFAVQYNGADTFSISNASGAQGAATFKNAADSTAALSIQAAGVSGDELFRADTTNNRIYVGNSTAAAGSDTTLFVIDSYTGTNIGTAVDGAMAYDSSNHKFKCAVNGSWTDCSASGGGQKIMQSYNAYSINQGATATTAQGLLLPTTATAFSIALAGTTEFRAAAAGSFRACTIMSSAAVTSGSVSVRFRKNGANVSANDYCTLNAATPRTNAQEIASGVQTFVAGDTIGVALVSNTLAPITLEFFTSFVIEYGAGAVNTVTSLQDAYANGNTLSTTSGRDLAVTLADSATDSNMTVNVESGSTSKFAVQYNGADTFSISNAASAQGSALFKNAADNTAAFMIQNSAGLTLLSVDTANGYVIDNGVGSPGNLLVNPSFEAGLTDADSGWRLNAGGNPIAIINDPANARSGNKALRITPTGGSSTAYSKLYEVTPGDMLYLEGYAKSAVGTNGGGGLEMQFYDKDRGLLTFEDSGVTPGVNSYVLSSVTATVPANAKYVEVYPWVDTTSTTGTWYFDDLYFKRTTEQAPMVFQNSVDSASAFQVLRAPGTADVLFRVDTSGNQVHVGNNTAAAAADTTLFVVDTYTGSNVQAAVNGAIVYDDTNDRFMCGVNGGWVACDTTGSGGLAKNATDTSSAAAGAGFLYAFTNSSAALAGGVLQLNNGSNTGSALQVVGTGVPGAGNAIIFASLTNASTGATLLDLQAGSSPTSKFSVNSAGNVTAAGTYNSNTFDNNSLTFGGASAADISSAASQSLSVTGANGLTLQAAAGNVAITSAASTQINIGNNAVNSTINIGKTNGTANTTAVNIATATGAAQTIQVGGTGTGAATSHASTTVNLQAGATIAAVSNAGVTVRTFTNSTTAFQIQNASVTPDVLFGADTTANHVHIGNGTSAVAADTTLLVVDTYTGTNVGAAVNGAIVYDDTNDKFKCGVNNAWVDCDTTGGSSTTTLQDAYTNDATGEADILTSAAGKTVLIRAGAGADSATLFHVQSSGGVDIFKVDSETATDVLEVQIGDTTDDGSFVTLGLDVENAVAESVGCTASIYGSVYYNGGTNAVRACVNGAWEDLVSTAALGLQLFGVVPDSGPSGEEGDLGSLVTAAQSGPCKVSRSGAATVNIRACTAYSGGRKIVFAGATNLAIPLTNTNDWVHVCFDSSGNITTNASAGATDDSNLPAWNRIAPLLCLADITNGGTGTSIVRMYDVRTFTTTMKEYATVNAAMGLGRIVTQSATVGLVQNPAATAGLIGVRGIVVASSGVASATARNVVIATQGPQFIKGAGTSTVNQFAQTSATTASYTSSTATADADGYANIGLNQRTIDTACTLATNCQYSQLVNISLR